jgi:multimeric flavodoxin WrbA
MLLVGLDGEHGPSRTVSQLLDESMEAAKEECKNLGIRGKIEIIHLVPIVANFYDGVQKTPPKKISECLNIIRKAHALIFATPVYWFSTSSVMKAFVDWLTLLEIKDFALEGKVAGVIAHAHEDGGNEAAMAIVAPLLHMGVMIPPYCAFFKNRHTARRSEGQWQLKDHRLVGRNVVRLANRVRSADSWE